MYSISVMTSTKQLIAQVAEYYLLYFILFRAITKTETVQNIIWAMILATSLCCVFGLIEAYRQWSILTIFPSNLWIVYDGPGPLFVDWGRGVRIRSTFPHPILFGDALAMTIPLTLYLLSTSKRGLRRLTLLGSLVLMIWALYKTSSRGPWLAVAMSSVLLFILVHNRIRKYLVIMACLCCVVLLARPGIWQSLANLYEASHDSSSPTGSSYEYRSALTSAVNHAVGKSIGRTLLGYGLGTFRENGLEISFQGQVRRWYTCDNNWALFVYETGYIGFALTGLLLVTPLWMSLSSYSRMRKPEKYLIGVLFIVLAAFNFELLSVAGYGWGQQAFMAWIVMSLVMVYPRLVRREAAEGATIAVTRRHVVVIAERPLEGVL